MMAPRFFKKLSLFSMIGLLCASTPVLAGIRIAETRNSDNGQPQYVIKGENLCQGYGASPTNVKIYIYDRYGNQEIYRSHKGNETFPIQGCKFNMQLQQRILEPGNTIEVATFNSSGRQVGRAYKKVPCGEPTGLRLIFDLDFDIIAIGVAIDYGCGAVVAVPVPAPIPLPLPVPPYSGNPYGQLACSRSYDVDNYRLTFDDIKSFARKTLQKVTWGDDVTFANDWTQKYPCDVSSFYIREISAIKSLARVSLGKVMWGDDVAYALDKGVNSSCLLGANGTVNYITEADSFRAFARRSLGMISWGDAEAYAQREMEARYFRCSGLKQFRVNQNPGGFFQTW